MTRRGEWFVLLYVVTVSALANFVLPDSPATNPLFMIAIGLPMIFVARTYIDARKYIGVITGVVMALIGVVWLLVLALRAS